MRKELIKHMNNELLEAERDNRVYFRPLINGGDTVSASGCGPQECAKCGKTIKENDDIYSMGFTQKTAEESWDAHERLFGSPPESSFCKNCIDSAADQVKIEAQLIHACNTGIASLSISEMPDNFEEYRSMRIEEIETIRDDAATMQDESQIEQEWEKIEERREEMKEYE